MIEAILVVNINLRWRVLINIHIIHKLIINYIIQFCY